MFTQFNCTFAFIAFIAGVYSMRFLSAAAIKKSYKLYRDELNKQYKKIIIEKNVEIERLKKKVEKYEI